MPPALAPLCLAALASIPSPSSGQLSLGPLTLRAYGLCIALGVLAAVKIARARFEHRGGDPEMVSRICWWAVPAGLVGARMYHVATDWSSKYDDGRWVDALKIWEGGLGIWGGVALGTLVGCLVARRLGLRVLVLMDCAAPAIAAAQAIGRFGNWWNQELFGRPTDVPWALRIDREHRPDGFEAFETFHPTFLYEALWCALVIGAILLVERRFAGRLKAGQTFPLYVALYTVGRFWFETLRIDAATQVGGFRINEIVAPLVGLGAAVAFVLLGRRDDPAVVPTVQDRDDDDRAPTPGEPAAADAP